MEKFRFVELTRAKYTANPNDVQSLFTGPDSKGRQCSGIYPAQLVGGRQPPSPQCIGEALPNAQAAVGVCWPVHTGQKRNARREPPPEGAGPPTGSTTIAPEPVVGKCALSRGPVKRTERPGHPRTLPLRFLLLVNHRPSSLRHSATNEPQPM